MAIIGVILFFTLGGSSGSSSEGSKANKGCVGTWQIYSMSMGDDSLEITLEEGDAELYGLDEMFFTFEPDGTGYLGDSEETVDFVWTSEGNTCIVTDEDNTESFELELSGGDLVLEEDGFVVKFRRG